DDGDGGISVVRGHAIPALVAQGYEATVALMWEGFAGENLTRAGVIEALGTGRAVAFSRLGHWPAPPPPLAGSRPSAPAVRSPSHGSATGCQPPNTGSRSKPRVFSSQPCLTGAP